MANKLALALVIGGAVSSSLGSAFNTVSAGIGKLEKQGNKAKVLQSTIGETIKLRDEWKRAHDSGAAGADKLQRRLNGNLEALRKQGVEVGRLSREYQRLGREAKSADLQMKGRAQIGEGAQGLKATAGQGLAYSAALAIPTKVSGDYQASIRQMALWAHIAGDGEEQQMADQIANVAKKVGMGQQALAAAVGGLIEKGIDWQESVDYAPIIADLIDGQGMEGETIATLFSAFKEAGVKKEEMGAMLGQVAAAGDIGAFGPKDMARYMPSLLGTIKTLGMEGPEAVRFLGASLQSQYKQTQDSASAATNMNNLLNAVISSTSQERFAKEGIDLAGSIGRAVKTGKAANPVEAYIKLTDVLLKQQNPTKFKEVQALKKRIQESADGSAEEAQAMASLLQSAGLATIVSDQSASAGLLAQIKYGDVIKEDMATIKDTDGKAKIEQDADKARDTSNARWGTVKASSEAAMTRIGDAIRPLTDKAADVIAEVTYAIGDLVAKAPTVVTAIAGIGAALIAFRGVTQGLKIGKGLLNLARSKLLGGAGKDEIQKVFVTNQAGGVGRVGGVVGGAKSGRSKVLGLLQAGLRVVRKASPSGAQDAESPVEQADKPAGGVGLMDTGLEVLDALKAGGSGDEGAQGAGVQKVFVVNMGDFGGIGSAVGGRGRGRRKRGRREGAGAAADGRRRNRTGGGEGNRPARAPSVRPAAPVSKVSRIGSALGATGSKLSAVGRRLPGGALFNAGMSALNTTMTAKTREEKAEGYGSAAGGLAGTLAGAAAGAAIGSVVPVIGTAIGGAVGAALGGMGGESLGSWLSKRLFGDDREEEKPAPQGGAGDAPLPVTVAAGETAPVTINPIALPPVVKTVITPAPAMLMQDRAPLAMPAPVVPPAPLVNVAPISAPTPVPAAPAPPSRAPLLMPTPATPPAPVVKLTPVAAPAPVVNVAPISAPAPVVNVASQGRDRPAPAPAAPVPPSRAPLLMPAPPVLPAPVVHMAPSRTPAPVPPAAAPAPVVNLAPVTSVRDTGEDVARGVTPDRSRPAIEPPPPALGDALRAVARTKAPMPPVKRPEPAHPAGIERPEADRVSVEFPPAPPSPLGSALRNASRVSTATPAPIIVRPRIALPAAVPAPAMPVVKAMLSAPPERAAGRVEPSPYPAAQPRPLAPDTLGEVVRQMAKAKPPEVKLPDVAKPAKAQPPKPVKFEQVNHFTINMPFTVNGDVKSPEQLVQAIQGPIQRIVEDVLRDQNARAASIQLYDAPHV